MVDCIQSLSLAQKDTMEDSKPRDVTRTCVFHRVLSDQCGERSVKQKVSPGLAVARDRQTDTVSGDLCRGFRRFLQNKIQGLFFLTKKNKNNDPEFQNKIID